MRVLPAQVLATVIADAIGDGWSNLASGNAERERNVTWLGSQFMGSVASAGL
jgi:hypothetical protein